MLKVTKRLTPLLAMWCIHSANAAWIETGAEVESRPGVKTMYVVSADKNITDPKAVKNMVLLVTGAAGVIPPATNGIREQKPGRVALRGYFAENFGVLVAVGLPSDQPGGITTQWREGSEHTQDIIKVMEVMLKQYPAARITVLGFSNGCRSAASVSAAARKRWGESLQNVVMLSCSKEAFNERWISALDGTKGDKKVPMLVVHHKRDNCLAFENIEGQAKWHDFIAVDDSKQPRPNPVTMDCGNGSAHVFGGKEDKVYQAVIDWINTGKTTELKYEK